MSGLLKKVEMFVRSLFIGMKAADDVISTQSSGENGIEVNQQIKPGGVFSDMLETKVTKEVEELRDKSYRVYREANNYDRGSLSLEEETIINEKGEEETVLNFTGNVKKKTKIDFMKRPEVFEKERFVLRVIQDVKHFEKSSMFSPEIPNGIYDFDTNLSIERDFLPRFEIEKFAKKIVVRNNEDGGTRAEIDIYVPSEASQFGKIDAILIANLHRMRKEKNYRSDITDFSSISWVTDHAWNCEDMCSFKYDDCKLIDIILFDGSFVLTFDCNIVEEGVDLTAKYKTKELDEKYKYESPKHDGIDIFTIKRNMDKDKKKSEIDLSNIGPSTFSITNNDE